MAQDTRQDTNMASAHLGRTVMAVVARYFAAPHAPATGDAMKLERLTALIGELAPLRVIWRNGVAYDLAFAVARGGGLPEPIRRLAVSALGAGATDELIHLVGLHVLAASALGRLQDSPLGHAERER